MTNPHLSDPSLRPFLAPTFSPIDYLNTTLPSLGGAPPATTTTTKTHPPSSSTTPTLSTLTSQTQSHISALTAQQTRLTTTLTSLTDEILRTSSRLAYEVELLRGEAVGLADALTQRGVLGEAIEAVVPGGLPPPPSLPTSKQQEDDAKTAQTQDGQDAADSEPPALPNLRTLHNIRTHLQSVIQVFNLALSFPFPPSLLTTAASNIVSITSPDADPDAERKGQAALAKLRGEVVELLGAGDTGGARRRVQELREVCGVWRGTGEERARGRWVEGLEGLVEGKEGEEEGGRERERERKGGGGRKRAGGREEGVSGGGGGGGGRQTPVGEKGGKEAGTGGGGGFLRRLRDEIYLD